MLLSVYKKICYIGLLLLAAYLFCEALLTTDDSGLKIHLGFGFTLLWSGFIILMFIFFFLPIYYIRSNTRKLFISIIITGILAMLVPAFSAWESISDWLRPKETTIWSLFDPFKISAFRRQVNNTIHIIFLCIFICQLVLFILTFRVKKQMSNTSAETDLDG